MTAFELWPPPVPPEQHSHQDLFKARISSGLSSLPATSPTPPHEKVSSLFPLLSGYRPESNLWRTPSSPLIFLLLDFTTWPLGMLSLCLPTLHTHSPLLYLVPCKWIESYSSPLYSSSFPSRPTHHPSPLCSLLQQVELSGPTGFPLRSTNRRPQQEAGGREVSEAAAFISRAPFLQSLQRKWFLSPMSQLLSMRLSPCEFWICPLTLSALERGWSSVNYPWDAALPLTNFLHSPTTLQRVLVLSSPQILSFACAETLTDVSSFILA